MKSRSARVRVFPPAIPALAVLLCVGADHVWPVDLGFVFPPILRYGVGGAIIIGSLLGLGLWSILLLRQTGQSENPWKPTTEIVDRGPFRLTRNPMYLQMLLVCFGLVLVLWNIWLLISMPLVGWALYGLAIRPEEAYLERELGDSYLAYKRRVRRWL